MAETVLFGAMGVVGVALAALGSLVYAHLRHYRRGGKDGAKPSIERAPLTGEAEAPLARYQPMFRLLAGGDGDFVRRHQSCPKVAERWEKSQRRVVRLYLRELAGDFQCLHREARAIAAQSPEQYRHMLPLLFKQQLVFWRAFIWIDLRLSLGSGVSRINPEKLLAAFEALRREIPEAAVRQHSPA